MASHRFLRTELAALAAVLLLAAAFRYWQIGRYPQALHYDEAINGLVTQDLLRGRLPELLTYDRAREPMIFYVMAVPVYLFGPTPGALRAATASASLALVAVTFLLMRELFGRRIGLLASLICAATVWPIYHGRLATRSILVPVVVGCALYAAVVAWRTRRKLHWTLAGSLFGLVFYTYANNLFVIPAAALTALGLFIVDRQGVRERKWGLLWAACLFVGAGIPIFVFRATHPPAGPGRPDILSMFYPGQSAADFARTVFAQAFLVGRMFFVKGDLNIRHNIVGRPVFDLLMAVPFVAGLLFTWNSDRRRAQGLMALWLAVWLLPTFVTKDAPHFLRASGALLSLFVWPALGLDWLRQRLQRNPGDIAGLLIAASLAGGSIAITARDYLFSGFLASPEVRQAYDGERIGPILEFDRRWHTGWVGANVLALPRPVNPPTLSDLDLPDPLPQPYAQYLIPWLFDPDWRQY